MKIKLNNTMSNDDIILPNVLFYRNERKKRNEISILCFLLDFICFSSIEK